MALFRWLATREGDSPDLIVLDVMLPQPDGETIAHALKANQHFKGTLAWLLSGKDGVADRMRGHLVGACMRHRRSKWRLWSTLSPRARRSPGSAIVS